MKHIILFLGLALTLGLHATKPPQKLITGTYGVCSFAGQDENSYKIEVTLNDDHSFRYIDNTAKERIDTRGTWELKGNKVILSELSGESGLTKKWTIDGKCLRSRKGLCWTRICHLNECK
jgi:hypothetical protein